MGCIWRVAAVLALTLAQAPGVPPQDKGEPTDAPAPPPAEEAAPATAPVPGPRGEESGDAVRCANLVYAGSKSSVCFSDRFLQRVERETNVETVQKFTQVKLSRDDLYRYPFAIMTGEGAFALQEAERKNLHSYLTRGGFLLASAGCSSQEWDRSFRGEIRKVFPDLELKKIPLDHPIYHTVFDVKDIRLSHGGQTLLEGLEYQGKIVLVYSPEGLNDTPHVKGCCCCGGNEVKNCQEINVNILVYALTH